MKHDLPDSAKKESSAISSEKSNRLKILIIIMAVILVGVATTLVVARDQMKHHSQPNSFDSGSISALNYPVYYPTQIPAGYHLNARSISVKQKILHFYLSNKNGSTLFVNEQAKSKSFDFTAYRQKIKHLNTMSTANGSVFTGTINSGKVEVGNFLSNQTWIQVTTNSSVPLSQITTMLEHLSASN